MSSTVLEDHQVICLELGLTPEGMAALGVQGSQVDAIFDELDDQSTLIGSLRSLQTQHHDALVSLKTAHREIRQAEDEQEENQLQAQIDQLHTDLATLNQGVKQAMGQLRQAILPEGVSTQPIEQVCAPTGLAAHVPVEFRFATLNASDYADLLPALAAERRAQEHGQEPDTQTQQTLNGYRNLPAVLTARSNLLYNLDGVRTAFNE